jgi:hypothetical protein
MSHDRVMRFVPVFDSHEQASQYAVAQALAWIDEQPLCTDTFTMITE